MPRYHTGTPPLPASAALSPNTVPCRAGLQPPLQLPPSTATETESRSTTAHPWAWAPPHPAAHRHKTRNIRFIIIINLNWKDILFIICRLSTTKKYPWRNACFNGLHNVPPFKIKKKANTSKRRRTQKTRKGAQTARNTQRKRTLRSQAKPFCMKLRPRKKDEESRSAHGLAQPGTAPRGVADSTCRTTLEYSAASTRVLSAEYAPVFRKATGRLARNGQKRPVRN